MKTRIVTMLLCAGFSQLQAAKTVPTHAIANLVIGKPDFTTSSSPIVSSFSLSSPAAIAIDPMTEKLFIADGSDGRILRYASYQSLKNGDGAEAVFGQSQFSGNTSGSGTTGLGSSIWGLFFDRYGRLWVGDASNHRVLVFEAASYRSNSPAADRVFGQPDFLTTTPGTTASKMNFPAGVFVDSQDRLWVADVSNNRVLRFNSISTKPSGSAADGVLGQADFTTSTAGSGTTGIQTPYGISYSETGSLFVACSSGNRVLRFDNAANLGNGASANAVLGQADFATTSSGTSAIQFNGPRGVFITTNDTLWVTDRFNHRVLRFDKASSKPNGAAADGVVGQPDFTSNSPTTTSRSLSSPRYSCLVDSKWNLWVLDNANRRVLRFAPDVTKPTLVVTTSVPKNVSKKRLKIKGTASDTYGISKVYYRVGSSGLKTAKGTTSWKFKAKLKSGKNKIRIYSVDSVGNKSRTRTYKVKR